MDRLPGRTRRVAVWEPSRHEGRGVGRARRHGGTRARRRADSGVWHPAGPAGWLRAAGVVIIGPGGWTCKTFGFGVLGCGRRMAACRVEWCSRAEPFGAAFLNPMVGVRARPGAYPQQHRPGLGGFCPGLPRGRWRASGHGGRADCLACGKGDAEPNQPFGPVTAILYTADCTGPADRVFRKAGPHWKRAEKQRFFRDLAHSTAPCLHDPQPPGIIAG